MSADHTRRKWDMVSVLIISYICIGCNNTKVNHLKKTNDDFYEKCRALVLCENVIGQEYSFYKDSINRIDELSITYLGNIITRNKDTLKIINSINYWGCFVDSKHATGRFFIYNSHNLKIGLYNVGDDRSLPTKIEGSSLVFRYNNDFCNQTTLISLLDSIPKSIFVNCTKKGGDFYSFTNE